MAQVAGATVVTIGRTPPVPQGQQTMQNSLPVAIASDQTAIPTTVENLQISEVSLSLLWHPPY